MPSTNGLYNRLSNRMIAFLTLLIVLPLLGFGWYFAFTKNVGTVIVTVEGSASGTVVLEKSGIAIAKRECPGKCEFRDIPVGEYDMIASADWFRSVTESLSLMRWDEKSMTVSLARMATIVSVDPVAFSGSLKENETLAGLWNSGTYIVKNDPFTLIGRNDGKENILYRATEGYAYSTGSVACGYFLMKNQASGYDALRLSDGRVTHIPETDSVILFVKSAGANSLVVITESGSSLFDARSGRLTDIPLYDDILSTPGWNVLGLVKSTSTKKKSLLNVQGDGSVLFFEDKKDRRVLAENLQDAELICQNGKNTEIISSSGEIRRVNAYE